MVIKQEYLTFPSIHLACRLITDTENTFFRQIDEEKWRTAGFRDSTGN